MTSKNLGAKTCFNIFMFTAFISFLYALLCGKYNGDFAGVLVYLGCLPLLLVFLLSILPFVLLWVIYSFFKHVNFKEDDRCFLSKRVTSFFLVFMTWSFFVTVLYGVGIMATSQNTAPGAISYIIYLTNRIDVFYLGVLFILLYNGRFLIIAVFFLCLLGILREGIGVFLYVTLALIVKYNLSVTRFLFKRPLLSLFLIFIAPFLLELIFTLRSVMRAEDLTDSLSVSQLIIGKLIGRFSSFSNFGMIMQSKEYFLSNIPYIDPFYFIKHYLSAFVGKDIIPDFIPERLLINIFGGDLFDKSYMVGLAGNLYVSALIDPLIMILNFVVVMTTIILVFIVCGQVGFDKSNEYALILLLYPCMSGSAQEFSKLLLSLFLILIILKLCKIRLKIHRVSTPRGE